jgi:hypothetical protein
MDGDSTDEEELAVAAVPSGGVRGADGRRPASRLAVGSSVCVEKACGGGGATVRWCGRVAEAAAGVARGDEGRYKVTYAGWGPRFDEWLPAAALLPLGDATSDTVRRREWSSALAAHYAAPSVAAVAGRSSLARVQRAALTATDTFHALASAAHAERTAARTRQAWLAQAAAALPEVPEGGHGGLSSGVLRAALLRPCHECLHAHAFCSPLPAPHRASRRPPPPALQAALLLRDGTAPDTAPSGQVALTAAASSALWVREVALALLTLEAALPAGSVDVADAWAPPRAAAWASFVASARSAAELAAALVALEDAIRPAWFLPGAASAFRQLPCRSAAVSLASRSGVAQRLFLLDASLAYDRVQLGHGSHAAPSFVALPAPAGARAPPLLSSGALGHPTGRLHALRRAGGLGGRGAQAKGRGRPNGSGGRGGY